jgi:acylphosphatase
MPDGTVEVRAAGPPEDLESLRERLARGPSPARVDDIRESAIESTADLPGGFEVRY